MRFRGGRDADDMDIVSVHIAIVDEQFFGFEG
jgi:hypothetical protein